MNKKQPDTVKTTKRKGLQNRTVLVPLIAGIVLLCLLAVVVGYSVWYASPKTAILDSIRQTTAPGQMKFHVTVDTPASATQLTVDGVYKSKAGLSATAVSSQTGDGVKTTKTSKWVIDAPGSTLYANLTSFKSEFVGKTPLTAAEKQSVLQATNAITRNNQNVWSKAPANSLGSDNTYGLPTCMLIAFYKIQSGSVPLQDFVTQLLSSSQFSLKETKTNTYTIVAKPGQESGIATLYRSSDLSKALVQCNSEQYAATSQAIAALLQKTTITLTRDGSSKLITSFSVAIKDSSTISATFTPAHDVTITIPTLASPPKVDATTTAESYMQQNMPYLYKNLMNLEQHINDPPQAAQ